MYENDGQPIPSDFDKRIDGTGWKTRTFRDTEGNTIETETNYDRRPTRLDGTREGGKYGEIEVGVD